MIDKLIEVLTKEESIKKVFTINQEKHMSTVFVKYVHSLNLSIDQLKDDIISIVNVLIETPLRNIENNIIKLINCINFDEKIDYDMCKLAYLKILLLLYVSSGEIVLDDNWEKILLDGQNNTIPILYRGQSNFSYDLLPSIYRNLDYNGVIDYSVLQQLYQSTSMYHKYYSLFGSYTIDYSFVSFMQHATEFSPLLDFSKNKDIALIFATNSQGKNYNYYENTDCSLFSLKLNKNKNREFLDFTVQNVQFNKDRLKYNTKIFGKPLILCSLQDFEVDYQTCLFPTNDRMKYQQGAFLYIHKCVIANGKLFFPFSQGLITKRKIYAEKNNKGNKNLSKQTRYKDIINKYPYYDMEHLLDPYLYFSEYNK